MINLNLFKSECEEKQKIIVSHDVGTGDNKHIANNKDRSRVRHFKVDEEIIKDGEKCDYLLLNDDRMDAYFIELKGSDILKAIDQVERTSTVLQKSLSGYDLYYRIIYKSGTHSIHSPKVNKWKEVLGRNKNTKKPYAVIRQKRYEEDI